MDCYLENRQQHVDDEIVINGTGNGRHFIYVEDLADAVIYFMNKKVKHHLINIGSSQEQSIKEFAKLILKVLKVKLKIKFDNNKKWDGMKSKVLDTTLAKRYGWKPKIKLNDAILETYEELKKNFKKVRN